MVLMGNTIRLNVQLIALSKLHLKNSNSNYFCNALELNRSNA